MRNIPRVPLTPLSTRLAVCISVLAVACLPAVSAQPKELDLLRNGAWEFSVDGGKSFSATTPSLAKGKSVRIIARCRFTVRLPRAAASLELRYNTARMGRATFTINGAKVAGPLAGMSYDTIRGIDAKILKNGANVLKIDLQGRRRYGAAVGAIKLEASLVPLSPKNLRFYTSPVLGAAGSNYFTVACRTNMLATVSVRRTNPDGSDAVITTSHAGINHRFKIRDAKFAKGTKYLLVAKYGGAKAVAEFFPKQLPARGLKFVVLGDSRSNPGQWRRISEAVRKADPDLFVHTGDMVSYGRSERQWNTQFFDPARELLRRVPCYSVIGNHEVNSPLFFELLQSPSRDGRGRHWKQRIGDVLLVGIDGFAKWSPRTKAHQWLDKTLGESTAKFIFVFSHYPAWSSSRHGAIGKTGSPAEQLTRTARNAIWPLLVKHKITAMIAGHDHCYERSEPTGGVTQIISAGAGAGLYGKGPAAQKQNPHSKVFAAKHHYALFELRGDTCSMRAVTLDGKVLDTRTWQARRN